MSFSSEKSILPSKLLSGLIAFSMFLLISSSLSLLEFQDNPFLPESVLRLILVNKTSPSPIPNAIIDTQNSSVSPITNAIINTQNSSVKSSPVKSPVFPSETLEKQNSPMQKVASQDSDIKKTMDQPQKYERKVCDSSQALLRVYMYDLPPKFHFGLLGWKGSANQTWPSLSDQKTIPSYPGGLNLQHSPEYWLTLDVLASNMEDVVRPCSAIRVQNSSEADVIFVPFFSSLSYNRHSKRHANQKATTDRQLQEELVKYLKGGKEWKRLGGRDHLVLAHHPNSMLVARKHLRSSMFLLSDFGRYPKEIANLEKDVIAPYKHMVKTIPTANSPSFNERPTLVYFQGAIFRKDGGVIRQQLYNLLRNEKDVHFKFGSVQANGIREAGKGLASSKFCLNIAGDTPSSNRLFDAIASHCVPVIISDDIELPYEDALDYSEFCIFVRGQDAVRKGYLLKLLRGITQEKWTKMWEVLKNITVHFEYQYPSQANDAVDMIWQTIARKKTSTQLIVHRNNRYSRSQFL